MVLRAVRRSRVGLVLCAALGCSPPPDEPTTPPDRTPITTRSDVARAEAEARAKAPSEPAAAAGPTTTRTPEPGTAQSQEAPRADTSLARSKDPPPAADPLAGKSDGHFRAVLASERGSGPPPGQDADIIRRKIRANIGRVRACYTRGLARDAGLRGRVDVVFTISPKGATTVRETTSTLKDAPDVERCIADVVAAIDFPGAKEEVTVTYPFVLEPG